MFLLMVLPAAVLSQETAWLDMLWSHQTLESARLPGHLSAQAAELFALIRACHLVKYLQSDLWLTADMPLGLSMISDSLET